MFHAHQMIARLAGGEAKYIVRLDDACETQDADRWSAIERILDRNNIKPIVAVIPRNEDTALFYDNKDDRFWSKVKSWEEKGWVIAQHGFTHRRHAIKSGSAMLPLHGESEFVGLPYHQQCDLIRQGYEIFKSHGIHPSAWISPCHTHDFNTISAIKAVTEIKIVSDGIACYPYSEHGLDFLPQQLWWPKWRPFGIWTICLHPSNMSAEEMAIFEKEISGARYQGRIIDPISALSDRRNGSCLSFFYKRLFWTNWRLRKGLKKMLAARRALCFD